MKVAYFPHHLQLKVQVSAFAETVFAFSCKQTALFICMQSKQSAGANNYQRAVQMREAREALFFTAAAGWKESICARMKERERNLANSKVLCNLSMQIRPA
jgi:hypothetical protein